MLPERKQRILVVESSPYFCEAIKDILELEGYTALAAKSPTEALHILDIFCPDALIISTYYGIFDDTLFERCAKHYPICYLTLPGEWSRKVEAHLSSQDSYLLKPFEADEMFNALKRILQVGKYYFDAV